MLIIAISFTVILITISVILLLTRKKTNDESQDIQKQPIPQKSRSILLESKIDCDTPCSGENTKLNKETCQCECVGNWIEEDSIEPYTRRSNTIHCIRNPRESEEPFKLIK